MKFEIMDNSCTFVVQVRQTCIITYFVMGFFMPVNRLLSHDIRLLYSRGCSLQYMCIGFGDFERHNSLSHFIIHISFMPNPMKYAANAQGVLNARAPRRNEGKLLSEIKELQKQLKQMTRKFEIEKECKNQAYYWILSSGNFNRFAEFHKKHPASLDNHGACLAQLYLDSLTDKEY